MELVALLYNLNFSAYGFIGVDGLLCDSLVKVYQNSDSRVAPRRVQTDFYRNKRSGCVSSYTKSVKAERSPGVTGVPETEVLPAPKAGLAIC